MRIISGILSIFITVSLVFTGCNSDEQPHATVVDPYTTNENFVEQDYWAKENFDLERVGNLLERSDDPGEFERYLNEEDGINNLDLNGDGYVDYISVDEYQDRDSNARGLSLFTRFGPDLIQEIATILFYRDDVNYPGARILVTGNEHLYGDNYYYETNWLDRSLDVVSFLFSDRDQFYRSPYYYDYYPSYYTVYEVVETPVYRTRIVELYPEPLLVYTTTPTIVNVTNIKIKSPHNGQRMEKIHAKLAKPTKEQAEFIKSVPPRGQFGKKEKIDKVGKPDVGQPRADSPPKADPGPDVKPRPNPPSKGKSEIKPAKPNSPAQGQGQGKAPGSGQGQDKAQGGGGQGKGQPAGQDKGKKP